MDLSTTIGLVIGCVLFGMAVGFGISAAMTCAAIRPRPSQDKIDATRADAMYRAGPRL